MNIFRKWENLHEEGVMIVDNLSHHFLNSPKTEIEFGIKYLEFVNRSLSERTCGILTYKLRENHWFLFLVCGERCPLFILPLFRPKLCTFLLLDYEILRQCADMSDRCKAFEQNTASTEGDVTNHTTDVSVSTSVLRGSKEESRDLIIELASALDDFIFALEKAFQPKELIMIRLREELLSRVPSLRHSAEQQQYDKSVQSANSSSCVSSNTDIAAYPWLQTTDDEKITHDDLSSSITPASIPIDFNGFLLAWKASIQGEGKELSLLFFRAQALLEELSRCLNQSALKPLLSVLITKGLAEPTIAPVSTRGKSSSQSKKK